MLPKRVVLAIVPRLIVGGQTREQGVGGGMHVSEVCG